MATGTKTAKRTTRGVTKETTKAVSGTTRATKTSGRFVAETDPELRRANRALVQAAASIRATRKK